MLDPLGRTFMLIIRKQFLPASFYEQRSRSSSRNKCPRHASFAELSLRNML